LFGKRDAGLDWQRLGKRLRILERKEKITVYQKASSLIIKTAGRRSSSRSKPLLLSDTSIVEYIMVLAVFANNPRLLPTAAKMESRQVLVIKKYAYSTTKQTPIERGGNQKSHQKANKTRLPWCRSTKRKGISERNTEPTV